MDASDGRDHDRDANLASGTTAMQMVMATGPPSGDASQQYQQQQHPHQQAVLLGAGVGMGGNTPLTAPHRDAGEGEGDGADPARSGQPQQQHGGTATGSGSGNGYGNGNGAEASMAGAVGGTGETTMMMAGPQQQQQGGQAMSALGGPVDALNPAHHHSNVMVPTSGMDSTMGVGMNVSVPMHLPTQVAAASSATVNVYPLEHYFFGSKEAKGEKDSSVQARLARMEYK